MPQINLFTPGRIGGFETPNRVVMAPMTRSRASAQHVPSELAIEYYAQRASAGLIITEGTGPSIGGMGYPRTPAIYSAEQVAAWKKIVDAVHARGGHIFLQLMHVGRIAHSANRLTKEPPVAPSALRAAGQMYTDALGMQDNDMPRALETGEIRSVIAEYASATKHALDAGFDGVELHAASGYLPNQFLVTGANHRTDEYGGTLQNRLRFVIETLEAMITAAGTGSKVGMKISPAMPFNDIQDDDTLETHTALAESIGGLGMAYLHVLRSAIPDVIVRIRAVYRGTLLGGGAFNLESGNAALAAGTMDFIVYGQLYLANPDLVERFAGNKPLASADPSTFYTPGAKGCTDYPVA